MAKPVSRPSKRGGSSIFAGVLIGLIVGAVLAVGVALWATGVNPFASTKVKAPAPAPVAVAPAVPDTAPSFDFYKVLPGGVPEERPQAAAPAPRLYLQAGAFHSPTDADNLKAQLAMLGLEAAIHTADVPGKGILHRVRLGPFGAMDDVDNTRKRLAQNNIPVTLVREEPPLQETP
ncbi:MAG: SPOR domain-containing protein [Gammaproteobacteria bacterium]